MAEKGMLKMDLTTIEQPAVITFVETPPFTTNGILYFLDGHYLFRYPKDGAMVSKFVTAADVAAAFSRSEQDTGWLPAGVVRTGSNVKGPWFVYSAPEQKREIWIDQDEQITVPIPRTVLLGIGGTYYLWALAGKHFNAIELAYRAPFPNIYPNGKICWGTNTPPAANAQTAREVWDLFFKSPFNGDLATTKSISHPNDVRAKLRELAGTRNYPLKDLVDIDHRRTIGSLVDQMLKES
jgi:hypothetical protein